MRLSQLALLTAITFGFGFSTPVSLAFAAGSPQSVPSVGEALIKGDLATAFRTTLALAHANDLEAQHNLSLFYWHGVGSSQKFDEAVSWSTMAAIRGYKRAITARKIMLHAIDAQIEKKAMDAVRKCLINDAEAGDNSALLPLSTSFLKEFAPPNDLEAYFWSTLAFSMGKIEARRQRDLVMGNMQQADIVKTQQRANDWLKQWRNNVSDNANRKRQTCDLINNQAMR